MYRAGHFGTALLAYAPVGAGLLLAGFDGLAAAGAFGTVALSTLPDVDHSLPFVTHRGGTHTLAFALLVGLVAGTAGLVVAAETDTVTALRFGGFGFLVGSLAITSHLLADVITPSGIRPFWPFASNHYTFRIVRADNAAANYLLLALGVFVSTLIALGVRG